MNWITEQILKLWIWTGQNVFGFDYIDVYSPDKEDVVAITFSSNKKYIDKLGNMEGGE